MLSGLIDLAGRASSEFAGGRLRSLGSHEDSGEETGDVIRAREITGIPIKGAVICGTCVAGLGGAIGMSTGGSQVSRHEEVSYGAWDSNSRISRGGLFAMTIGGASLVLGSYLTGLPAITRNLTCAGGCSLVSDTSGGRQTLGARASSLGSKGLTKGDGV